MTAVVIRLFSAYAEVFPSTSRVRLKPASFLCLRRGVSESERIIFAAAWLFSAYAEVFLNRVHGNPCRPSFLCLRRGVSFLSSISHPRDCFSLPTQRCFWRQGVIYGQWRLFSAYAEVFPHSPFGFLPSSSFLCLRRGVSRWKCLSWVVGCFSLPTQRCFRHFDSSVRPYLLFSAYAEVFPHFI